MYSGFVLSQGLRLVSVAAGWDRRNLSQGVSSETSVASYICTASPKNSEKLYCISEYSLSVHVAASSHSPLFLSTRVLEPSALTRITIFDFHHFGENAWRII